MNGDEANRRQSLEDALYNFFVTHPHTWFTARDLRPIAGDAWRSRLVQVRRRVAKADLEVQWNRQNGGKSAYMLRSKALGPSAETTRPREARLF